MQFPTRHVPLDLEYLCAYRHCVLYIFPVSAMPLLALARLPAITLEVGSPQLVEIRQSVGCLEAYIASFPATSSVWHFEAVVLSMM